MTVRPSSFSKSFAISASCGEIKLLSDSFTPIAYVYILADRVRFELTVPVKARQFSRLEH